MAQATTRRCVDTVGGGAEIDVVVMPTTVLPEPIGRIGLAAFVSSSRVESGPGGVTRQRYVDLILLADASASDGAYGQWVTFTHIVRRDVRAHAWDYGLGAVMVGVALVALVTRIDVQDADAHRFRPDTWWGWAATLAVCASLAGRRRWPLRVLAFALVLVLPLELARHRDTVAFFAVVIVLYSAAAQLAPRLAVRAVAMVAAFYAMLAATGVVVLSSVPVLGPLFLASAFALGLMIHRGRAGQQSDVDAAIERAAAATETAELAAADERLRLAQELHDVVAHSLSVIAVQAGIGAHLIDRRPAEASRALDAIRTTCDTTDRELTRLVDVLRDGGATVSAKAPTIADVAALAEQIRSADLPVDLAIDGDVSTVPAGVSLAAYRIVQEALTNVVRHSGNAAAATVTIRVVGDRVELTIDDNGRGVTVHQPLSSSGGNGLPGMSERARLYGGEVQAGPRPGGGFRVRAVLRLQADDLTGADSAIEARLSTDNGDPTPDRRRFSPWAADAALAVLMAAIAMVDVVAFDSTAAGPNFAPTHLWALSLRVGCAATLAFRRRYPTFAYGVAWAFGLALSIGDYRMSVMVFVLWIGLYSVAAYAPVRHLVVVAVGTCIGIVAIAWWKPPDLTGAGAVWAGVFFAASGVAGYAVRRDRDQRASEVGERQKASAAFALHTRLVLANERLRIADELGTVLTHSIHRIAQHAEVGSRLAVTDARAARSDLQAISSISRDALSDLRRLLKHMRTTTEPPAYAPTPALNDSAVGNRP